MAFEDDYQDVLQNIEFGIIQVYQEEPDLIDAEVLTAIEALIRTYGAEAEGKSISSRPLRGISRRVADSVKLMCELRLGRALAADDPDKTADMFPPKTVSEIVACLKRIQSSIKFWTQKSGRQGYLDFVSQFVG
ncbi:MAG: hypothetical protein VKJ46_15670 [Leptolyngbyaceae bacterium]|nr:hypothetical protein [Leptolyngbyaceae bacterium]